MICPGCAFEVHPMTELDESMRPVDRCPRIDCRARLSLPVTPGVVHTLGGAIAGQTAASYQTAAPVSIASVRLVQVDELGEDIVQLAKKRLAAVRGEIEALDRLRVEARSLERMIRAAERAPRRRKD